MKQSLIINYEVILDSYKTINARVDETWEVVAFMEASSQRRKAESFVISCERVMQSFTSSDHVWVLHF